MKRAITILAGCLLVTSGLARTAEPVFEFECDTPAGHFSHWSQTLEPGKVTVKGTVTISEKREHERWNPAAAALFIGNPSGTFGLQIYTLKTRKDVLLLRITKPGTRDEEPFAMIAGDTTSVPFSLTLGKDGRLEVTAAGKTATTTVKGYEPRGFQLSCSTGDFLFHEVVIRK